MPLTRRDYLIATLAIGTGLTLRRSAREPTAIPLEVEFRSSPIRIFPHGELSDLVPVDRVRKFLKTMLPCWLDAFPKQEKLVHAFRLWGPTAQFDTFIDEAAFVDKKILSGRQMESIFLDSRQFELVFPGEPPILTVCDGLIDTRTSLSFAGSKAMALIHTDKLLRALAELGYDTSTSVVALDGIAQVADGKIRMAKYSTLSINEMLKAAAYYFDLSQELEWTAEALARYLAPSRRWQNRFGDSFCFDDVVSSLLHRNKDTASCRGMHIAYCLTCLKNIDCRFPILSTRTRSSVDSYLARHTEWIVSFAKSFDIKRMQVAPLDNQRPYYIWIRGEDLLIAGHELERLAFCPAPIRPFKTIVKRLVDKLLDGVEHLNMYARSGDYAPLSHAALGLCHLTGKTAVELVSEG